MDSNRQELERTLSRIENIGLPHPSSAILSSFVSDALNPISAARYVNARLSIHPASSLVSDWTYIVRCLVGPDSRRPPSPDPTTQRAIARRDGARCCITGKTGTFLDPLVVAPILPIPAGWATDKTEISDMLGAFFGPPYRDWWLSYIKDADFMSPFHNHWLVQKSAARSFAQGFVKLDRLQSSMVEYEANPVLLGLEEPIKMHGMYPLLGDHSRSGIDKVDARFVGSHARFCRSVRFLDIAADIERKDSDSSTRLPPRAAASTSRSFSLTSLLAGTCLAVWLLFPATVRITAYEVLLKLGRRLYGKVNEYSTVQKLPFGLYLKYHGEPDGFRNEFNALIATRRLTSIPVPRPLDLVVKPGDADDDFSSPEAYLLITRLPGAPLARCDYLISDKDLAHIASQMKDYLSQLRSIPKTVNTGMAICNTLGEACRDPRIQSGDAIGPFTDEAAFSQLLRFSDDPARRGHKIVFTHADLNPRNILVHETFQPDGRRCWNVSGIVDWENAGYYPEYWDYTKSRFEGFRWSTRYNGFVQKVFDEFGDYSRELDVERRSWESGDGM